MAIAGYKLRINGGALVNVTVSVGLVFTHVFTGLDPATVYSIEVASYDEFSTQSDWSPVETATTDA